MSDIVKLLTDENARKVAEDVVLALEEEGKRETVDFDFKMKEGRMERTVIENSDIREVINQLHGQEVPAPNTWFSFDSKLNSFLGFLKDIVCKAMDNDSLSETEFEAVQKFIPKVIKKLNNDSDLVERIRLALRRIVLNNDDATVFPLADIKVILFEFGAKEDYGDMIKVVKYARVSSASGKFVGEKNSVARDLMKRRKLLGFKRGQDTKTIYQEIVLEQKAAKNSLYEEVLPEDVEILAEAKECHIDLFADYSPLEKESLIAKLVASNKEKHESDSEK